MMWFIITLTALVSPVSVALSHWGGCDMWRPLFAGIASYRERQEQVVIEQNPGVKTPLMAGEDED